jgi:hypothetical protein
VRRALDGLAKRRSRRVTTAYAETEVLSNNRMQLTRPGLVGGRHQLRYLHFSGSCS